MRLKVKLLRPTAVIPAYARTGDAGADLCAAVSVVLEPGSYHLVPTGIAIELPQGTEAQLRPRSGLALNHGVTMLNAPGTIDQGYRGEIGVLLINHGDRAFEISAGMRIAQLVVAPVSHVEFVEVADLTSSERDQSGFGSTGH